MNRELQVITLGTTCFARYIVTKAGIKPTKEEGELTMPFDLAVHLPDFIPQIIASNFKGYLKDIRIDSNGIFEFFYKSNVLSKPKRLAWLNHDIDLKGDKTKLIQRYSKRIDNFIAAINKDKPTVFVQACEYSYNHRKLIEVIHKIRGSKPHKILFIDIGSNLGIVPYNNIETIEVNYPHSNYIWYEDAYRHSPDGVLFENEIIRNIQRIYSNYNLI